MSGHPYVDNAQHEPYIMGRFPESDQGIRDRAVDMAAQIQKQYADSTVRTLHLIVSHGTPIRMFSQLAGGSKKKIKFCGVTTVALNAGKLDLLSNCKHNHEKQTKHCDIQ